MYSVIGGGGSLRVGGSDTGVGEVGWSASGVVVGERDDTAGGDVVRVTGSGMGVTGVMDERVEFWDFGDISSLCFIIVSWSLVSDNRTEERRAPVPGPGSTIVSAGEGGGVPAPTRVVLIPPGAVRSAMSTMISTGSATWTATCALRGRGAVVPMFDGDGT